MRRLCRRPDCEGSSAVGAGRLEDADERCPFCGTSFDEEEMPAILRKLIDGIAAADVDRPRLVEITSTRQGEDVLFAVVDDAGSLLSSLVGRGAEAVDAELAIARMNVADG